MTFTFKQEDFDRIASVLGTEVKREGMLCRFELMHVASGRRLALEIREHLEMPPDLIDEQPQNLVSVYAANSFLQLQACTGYIASQELGEVIFFAKRGGTTSGLVVEREVGCSLYANVDDRLLSADFTQLPPEMIMSSVALSMTDTLFNDLG